MQKICFSYLILGAIGLWLCSLQNYALGKAAKEYYVFSEKGMKLRDSPSLESASKVLPYGAKVKVIKFKASEPFEVNRLTGYWSKVEAIDPKTSTPVLGYMFSSYLLPYPPPTNREIESPLKNYQKLLVKSGMDVQISVEQQNKLGHEVSPDAVTLHLSSLQEAFVMAKRIYRMPDSFKFPSIYRNIYVKADVLDKKSEDWKIHELKVEREEDNKTIKTLHYSMKNYTGTIHAYVEPLKQGGFKFSEFFAPQGAFEQKDKVQKGSAKQAVEEKRQG
ncbi:MAG: SH3 domain-containing protein [Oligoflexales bacterium]|nr:SH3 domain-containing protein [Oligoflexales bacterium]